MLLKSIKKYLLEKLEIEFFANSLGMYYKKSQIVDKFCNKVQNENFNLYRDSYQYKLLQIWKNYKKINIYQFHKCLNNRVCENIEYKFNNRV